MCATTDIFQDSKGLFGKLFYFILEEYECLKVVNKLKY